MLSFEVKSNPDSKLKVIHWNIESGNKDAFMMGGKLYKSMSIVIGETMEHFYCANTDEMGPPKYGSRYKKLSTEVLNVKENVKKQAIFTINDDEGFFVVKDNSLSKCTFDLCANNCIECKKYRSPFTLNNKIKECACYPSKKDFKSIDDSDLDSDDDEDIANVAQLPLVLNHRKSMFDGKFDMRSIYEE
jgi:hypothetical protein